MFVWPLGVASRFAEEAGGKSNAWLIKASSRSLTKPENIFMSKGSSSRVNGNPESSSLKSGISRFPQSMLSSSSSVVILPATVTDAFADAALPVLFMDAVESEEESGNEPFGESGKPTLAISSCGSKKAFCWFDPKPVKLCRSSGVGEKCNRFEAIRSSSDTSRNSSSCIDDAPAMSGLLAPVCADKVMASLRLRATSGD